MVPTADWLGRVSGVTSEPITELKVLEGAVYCASTARHDPRFAVMERKPCRFTSNSRARVTVHAAQRGSKLSLRCT